MIEYQILTVNNVDSLVIELEKHFSQESWSIAEVDDPLPKLFLLIIKFCTLKNKTKKLGTTRHSKYRMD